MQRNGGSGGYGAENFMRNRDSTGIENDLTSVRLSTCRSRSFKMLLQMVLWDLEVIKLVV